jgi:hypothetical protein
MTGTHSLTTRTHQLQRKITDLSIKTFTILQKTNLESILRHLRNKVRQHLKNKIILSAREMSFNTNIKHVSQNNEESIGNNGITHRSTRRVSRRNNKVSQTKHNLMPKFSDHFHNKSLVIGGVGNQEGYLVKNYLNETSGSIDETPTNKDMVKFKNSLEDSNSSFISTIKGIYSKNITSQKGGKSSELIKPAYLNTKNSTIISKPELPMQSFDKDVPSNFALKLPNVSAHQIPQIPQIPQVPQSTRNIDVKKSYMKLEEQPMIRHDFKILPSIKTNKILNAGKVKRVPNNRDKSMTVIKPGRLALQDENSSVYDVAKNTSMSRENSKKKGKLQFPLSRKEACIALEEYMFDYEQLEILDYDKVYFFNIIDRKSRKLQKPEGEFNFGFDNQHGDYRYIFNEHIAYRYEIIKDLGKGSFGDVLKVFDHLKKEFVALKILRNRKKLHKQGQVEIGLLEKLNNADPLDKKNIVRMRESFKFRNHI